MAIRPIKPLKPIKPFHDPDSMRGKSGIALTGNRVYNGGSRAPNPTGRNQHSTINTYAKQQMARNKAKLMQNRRGRR